MNDDPEALYPRAYEAGYYDGLHDVVPLYNFNMTTSAGSEARAYQLGYDSGSCDREKGVLEDDE